MSAPFAYRPLPGSIADRVIRHLQQQPPGTELATAVLAELVGQPASALSPILKPARDHGVLQARRLPHQGNNLFWSLAQPPQHDAPAAATGPAAPPQAEDACQSSRGFCCALFSDGRLVLEKPGQSMTLSADQTRELVRYLERMGDGS
ncbi:hypothetical protein [Caldimonas taiwanensis]|uniref:hypothetical protein n=1 Tax=Caldimonas taiwanensis TaxID=307483 RepID=UPI0007864B4F|nr:hypothetical protein [Caldimonas taiwanensis]